MPPLDEIAPGLLDALSRHYGASGRTAPRELPLAAILAPLLYPIADRRWQALVQTLRDEGWMEPARLAEVDPREFAEALRSRGGSLPDREIGRIRRVARWAADHLAEGAERAVVSSTELRESLAAINGVGPSTADRILLEGFDEPVYPLDRASYRIAVRHGWIDPGAEAEEARSVFERLGEGDPRRLILLASWLEQVGAEFCKPSKARCELCPLRPFLPEGGPIEPED